MVFLYSFIFLRKRQSIRAFNQHFYEIGLFLDRHLYQDGGSVHKLLTIQV